MIFVNRECSEKCSWDFLCQMLTIHFCTDYSNYESPLAMQLRSAFLLLNLPHHALPQEPQAFMYKTLSTSTWRANLKAIININNPLVAVTEFARIVDCRLQSISSSNVRDNHEITSRTETWKGRTLAFLHEHHLTQAQQSNKYRLINCWSTRKPLFHLALSVRLFRLEGPLGFYKGIVPNLMRVVPACCITFVTYEKVSGFLGRSRKKEQEVRKGSKNWRLTWSIGCSEFSVQGILRSWPRHGSSLLW